MENAFWTTLEITEILSIILPHFKIAVFIQMHFIIHFHLCETKIQNEKSCYNGETNMFIWHAVCASNNLDMFFTKTETQYSLTSKLVTEEFPIKRNNQTVICSIPALINIITSVSVCWLVAVHFEKWLLSLSFASSKNCYKAWRIFSLITWSGEIIFIRTNYHGNLFNFERQALFHQNK